MAGRKQHYIPQVLQRAFEASRTGTKSQVLVFRKGRAAYLTSTEGSAAERDFYSNPLKDGAGALDDKITDFESDHLTPILRELWSTKNGAVDSELAATAVAHLAFRTAHLRGAVNSMLDSAFVQMRSFVHDPEALRRFAGVDSMSSNSTIIEMVRNDLTKVGIGALPEKDRKALERVILFRIRERFDDLVAQSSGILHDGLSTIENGMTGIVAKSHARALAESLIPQERLRALRKLSWEVVAAESDERHYILPDCVAVANTIPSDEFKPFVMLSLDEALTVIMPLSARQILVGSIFAVQLTQAEINQQLAACSLDFFISSRRDDQTSGLAELIGTREFGLEQDLLNEDDVDLNEEPQVVVPNPARVLIRTPLGRFGDAIKKILVAIVKETVEPGAVDRIESIVVAGNIQAALKSIWNRPPTDSEVQAAQLGTMELLKSGSEWKCRVIVPRDLAGVLVQSGDALKKLEVARLIKIGLGRVYYIDCWARQCPQIFDRLELDFWGQIISKVAFRAASFYFGGLASASHELELPPGGNELQALASDLRLGFAGLQVTRQRYFVHQNLDHLISEAVQYVEPILVSMAYVCGFLEAKNGSIERNTDAGAVLLNEGLWEWGVLYSKDLRRHYEERNRWSSELELTELGEHVDRLLWTKGIVVSRLDEGCWIDFFGDEQMVIIKQVLSV